MMRASTKADRKANNHNVTSVRQQTRGTDVNTPHPLHVPRTTLTARGMNVLSLALLVLAVMPSMILWSFAQTPNNWDDMIWPLCGRLGENPGTWIEGQSCPTSRESDQEFITDVPIHHGYGFRNFNGTSRPISFHRGLDLATHQLTSKHGFVGNPIFSVAEGQVYTITGAGLDKTIEVKVPRNKNTAGTSQACTTTNPCLRVRYQHVQSVLSGVQVGTVLGKGQHIAYSGESETGFAHLHFEIRQPQLRYSGGAYSGNAAYYKDAVNPMRFLPYVPPATSVNVTFENASVAFPNFSGEIPAAAVTVSAAHGDFMLDFERLELQVYRYDPGQNLWVLVEKDETAILQETGVPALVEASPHMVSGYQVASGTTERATHDPELLNRMYTPYPTSTSKWDVEKTKTYYKAMFNQVHPGEDGVVELNAGSLLPPDGHRVHMFDYLLVDAAPNTSPSDHSWWYLTVGFQGYDVDLQDGLCFRATATMIPKAFLGNPPAARQEVAWYATNPARPCASAPFADD